MKTFVLILFSFLALLCLTSRNNYKEIKNEKLAYAFIANSSPTFKGYYYKGSDSDYHYFESKWDFEKDRYFKIPVSKLTISNKYKFKFGDKELGIGFFEEGDELFGENEFCRLAVVNPAGDKKDRAGFTGIDTTIIYYMIFGVYCGECGNHCATMYQYNSRGNANTLLVDSSDSYFKNNGEIKFDKPITDIRRLDLAQGIYKQIPDELLTTMKLTERFGCPDCTDGCGIYFEFEQGNKVKKFYIDYQTSQLPPNIKQFAGYLKATIEQLNEKR